jgi:8-oxo-dGTP pyrophosphatase MutT (NUDIX family)
VAVAVVTSPLGVLVGRRRDGVPPRTFPGGKIEPGESPGKVMTSPDLLEVIDPAEPVCVVLCLCLPGRPARSSPGTQT